MVSLQDKKVLLIGVGGVGSHVAVALCRAGIGQLEIVDFGPQSSKAGQHSDSGNTEGREVRVNNKTSFFMY